mmetsp:Transcript_35940/g.83851  ORF Transcript_35940/g.83851 Transcript_35940/m.83851 type:complete len:240 (-) Transcript_35940:9-728(-)
MLLRDALLEVTHSQQFLHLRAGVLLVATHDVTFGTRLKTDFVNLDVGAVSNKTDEGILREELEDLGDGVAELGDLVRGNAGVHQKEESRRRGGGSGGGLVFARREIRNQFSGQILFANVIRIMLREMISRHTERTAPQLGPKVYLTVRIQHCATRVATNRIVRQGRGRKVTRVETFQRSVQRGGGYDDTGGVKARAGPSSPGETNAVALLGGGRVPLTCLRIHGGAVSWRKGKKGMLDG